MNIKNFFPNLFFKAIEGITLFLPHEIITLQSHTNFFLINFQR